MIGLKTSLKIIFGLIYIILLCWFNILFKKDFGKCSFDEPCIRFCSDDRSSKSDLDLLEHFKKSELLDSPSKYKLNDGLWIRQYRDLSHYKVFRGEPECIDEVYNSSNKNFEYSVRFK